MKNWKLPITAAAAAALLLGSVSPAGAASADQVLSTKNILEIHTAAGSGEFAFNDGAAKQAAFHGPSSLIYDESSQSFLIADTRNQLIRKLDNKGVTSTAAGLIWGEDDLSLPYGSYNDGAVQTSVMNHPTGLAKDKSGNVYFADTENHAIRMISPNGQVTTIAGNGLIGSSDGAAKEALFYHPMDVAITPSGTIYVADTLNHVIRKIEKGQVTTIGASSKRVVKIQEGVYEFAGDYADGSLTSAKFNEPSGLALDDKGNLYVSDTGNQRIRYIDFAKSTVTTVAGGASGGEIVYNNELYAEGDYADGTAAAARFHAPRGLAVTPDGGLLVADSLNHVIRYLKDGKVSTIAGTADETSKWDGLASAAGFNTPTDVVWMGNGRMAVADAGNNQIRIVEPYQVPQGVKAGASVHLLLYQTELISDASPVIVSGTTFVPLRVLTEKLGFKVSYANGKTVLSKGDLSYTIAQGSLAVTKQQGNASSTVKLASAPFIKQNRMYVPVRFFAEEAGLDVQWLADVRAVLLREKLV